MFPCHKLIRGTELQGAGGAALDTRWQLTLFNTFNTEITLSHKPGLRIVLNGAERTDLHASQTPDATLLRNEDNTVGTLYYYVLRAGINTGWLGAMAEGV